VNSQVAQDQLVAQSGGGILLYSVIILAIAIFLGFFLAKRKGLKRFHWWPLMAAIPLIAIAGIVEMASLGRQLDAQQKAQVERND
jgi:uncharacterized membrane protein